MNVIEVLNPDGTRNTESEIRLTRKGEVIQLATVDSFIGPEPFFVAEFRVSQIAAVLDGRPQCVETEAAYCHLSRCGELVHVLFIARDWPGSNAWTCPKWQFSIAFTQERIS